MTETSNAKEQTPIIFLDDIRVVFNTRTGSILHPNKVTAVDGLTIKLMPGETIGICSASLGCGKSTTANVMCGLQAPHVSARCTSRASMSRSARPICERPLAALFRLSFKIPPRR